MKESDEKKVGSVTETMTEKQIKNKLLYCVAAFLCFGFLLTVTWYAGQKEQQEDAASEASRDYYMVVMGDSVLGQIRDETSIPAKLEEMLGKKVFNGALGGTCMGRLSEQAGKARMNDALSMVSFSKAIVSGDFRLQKALEITDNGTEHFPETIAALEQIDFAEVEVLLLGYGLNDYHAGETVYPSGDDEDEHTFVGALRSTIQMLQKHYPKLRIVLVTAPYTWYLAEEATCEEYVLGGNVLEDYVNAELAVANEMNVEVIDLYHDLYSHEEWEDWKIYFEDGVHPNEVGRTFFAGIIADYLAK